MAKKEKAPSNAFDSAFDFSDVFDNVEQASKIQSLEVRDRLDANIAISSGSLAMDLVILHGGYYPGRAYDLIGPESGGKTTSGNTVLGEALNFVPKYSVGQYYDYEGSLDTAWFMNIAGLPNEDPETIFGKRDKNGNWIIRPRIRLYKPTFGEQGLILMTKHLNSLPDKGMFRDEWWYTWSPVEAKVKKQTGGLTAKDIEEMLKQRGIQWDKEFLRKNKLYGVRIPENYGGCEGVFFVDSWASMTPRQTAEDDSAAMAQQGRMFARYINQIKTLISNKGWICLGVNQVRQNPNVRFGSNEYSPGGEALKHFCDCRNRYGSVSNPNGGGTVETENDGQDEYRHFKIRNRKNKISTPYGEISGRWWTKRDGQTGCGLDPVLDTIIFLEYTGQIEKTRKGYRIALNDNSKASQKLNDVIFSYENFKRMIVNKEVDTGEHTVKFDLRKHCHKQIKDGKAFELYYNSGYATPEQPTSSDEEEN